MSNESRRDTAEERPKRRGYGKSLRGTQYRAFWEEFFNLFRKQPALWDREHPSYRNRSEKERSLQAMQLKMRELHPNVTPDVTKRHMNNIRASFRREQYKLMARQKSGDKHTTKAWYYTTLEFLKKSSGRMPRRSKKSSEMCPDTDESNCEGDGAQSFMFSTSSSSSSSSVSPALSISLSSSSDASNSSAGVLTEETTVSDDDNLTDLFQLQPITVNDRNVHTYQIASAHEEASTSNGNINTTNDNNNSWAHF